MLMSVYPSAGPTIRPHTWLAAWLTARYRPIEGWTSAWMDGWCICVCVCMGNRGCMSSTLSSTALSLDKLHKINRLNTSITT